MQTDAVTQINAAPQLCLFVLSLADTCVMVFAPSLFIFSYFLRATWVRDTRGIYVFIYMFSCLLLISASHNKSRGDRTWILVRLSVCTSINRAKSHRRVRMCLINFNALILWQIEFISNNILSISRMEMCHRTTRISDENVQNGMSTGCEIWLAGREWISPAFLRVSVCARARSLAQLKHVSFNRRCRVKRFLHT